MFSLKKTKIIATIGPASEHEKTLEKLITLGVDGARLNLSHGSHQEHGRVIQLIRKIEKRINKHVAIVVDVQGPKIRIGNLPEMGLELKVGDEISIDTGTREFYENRIPLPSLLFRDGTKEGHLVFLDDGALQIKITSKYGGIFKAVVLRGGTLFSKKGVNVPELENTSSILNAKDKIDIEFAVKSKVDYVALSFIRSAKDVKNARKFLGRAKTKIIAKIERPEALLNIEEIVDEADAIMIARGDLGIETPLWELPIRQKEIIETARKHIKPVIVATQMLDSMIRNPLPTRAEVSDVANAVFDSADAVMLSGETALGKYPTEAVDMMRKILEATDNNPNYVCDNLNKTTPPASLITAKLAISMADESGAKAIIVEDADDSIIRAISHFRSKTPIISVTKKYSSADPLAIVWGVIPMVVEGKDLIRGAKTILTNMGITKQGNTTICIHKKENAVTAETI